MSSSCKTCRWFGFVETRTTVWPTYCGNAPDNRREDMQIQLERGNAPTLADFVRWFDEWVINYNAGHAHSGQGMDGQTPDQVFAACWGDAAKRTAPRELLDLLCMKRIGSRRDKDGNRIKGPVIGQNGVTWQGLRFGQFEPAMQRRLGQEVVLRVDERDISAVQVYTVDDQFICVAPSNQAVPKNASAQNLRAAHREKSRSRDLLKEYHQRRPRIADDLQTLMIHDAAARAKVAQAEAANNPPPPPNLQPVRHALKDQMPAIQRGIEQASNRVAVGAESMSEIPGGRRFAYQAADHADAETSTEAGGLSFRQLMARTPACNEETES